MRDKISNHWEAGDVIRELTNKMVSEKENTGAGRVLMKDGKWIVPTWDRPKGWQKMGLEEADGIESLD